MDTFLKLKTEASGYADWDRTPEDEDRYIANFFASEGTRLDKVEIRLSTARRGLGKLGLYSMWGKLTERNNSTKYKMMSDSHEF